MEAALQLQQAQQGHQHVQPPGAFNVNLNVQAPPPIIDLT